MESVAQQVHCLLINKWVGTYRTTEFSKALALTIHNFTVLVSISLPSSILFPATTNSCYQ